MYWVVYPDTKARPPTLSRLYMRETHMKTAGSIDIPVLYSEGIYCIRAKLPFRG